MLGDGSELAMSGRLDHSSCLRLRIDRGAAAEAMAASSPESAEAKVLEVELGELDRSGMSLCASSLERCSSCNGFRSPSLAVKIPGLRLGEATRGLASWCRPGKRAVCCCREGLPLANFPLSFLLLASKDEAVEEEEDEPGRTCTADDVELCSVAVLPERRDLEMTVEGPPRVSSSSWIGLLLRLELGSELVILTRLLCRLTAAPSLLRVPRWPWPWPRLKTRRRGLVSPPEPGSWAASASLSSSNSYSSESARTRRRQLDCTPTPGTK